jgi:diguanylate cyclase (GGDEF)-like protein
MDTEQQSLGARFVRAGILPLLFIAVAVLLHDGLIHAALGTPDASQTLHVLDFALLIICIIAQLFKSDQQEQENEGVTRERLMLITDMLNSQVAERDRELVESHAALRRENQERTHAEEQLQRASTLDPLTGLLKRAAFLTALDQERQNLTAPMAVYFIDIDHFKMINNGLGEDFADRVLIAIADRLAGVVPKGTLAGRVGGDEFAIACIVTDQSEALTFGDQMKAVLSSPIAIDTQRVHTNASLGLRISVDRDEQSSTLLRDAHMAMHRAKFAGRGRLVVFDPAMRDEVESRYNLTSDLHHAVFEGQIFVEYQPIHDLGDGRVIAYEALARWAHPDRGRVEPGVFIPAAEDSGLVAAIGEQVLRDACTQILARRLTPATPIGINLSARQLAQPDLCETIARILTTFEIDPLCILFEITESTIVESLNLARDVLLRLKEMGFRLAIDDFGTGYSSLSYLRELPFDVLKIDRAFVRHIETESHARDIVRMIVTLAESLDLTVVAEGIETEPQLNAIRSLGCYRGQGFLFSRPLPADEAFVVPPSKLLALKP